MANASKNKGKSWEREIAKLLSSIYGVNFQRVPNSGAYTGGFNAFRIQSLTPEQLLLASGDIILPSFLSHVSIECKFYKDFTFESLLTTNNQFNGWLEQASVGGKIPFVIFKINRKGGFIAFPTKYQELLSVDCNYLIYSLSTPKITVPVKFTVVKMEGFFEKNKNTLVGLSEENYLKYNSERPQDRI